MGSEFSNTGGVPGPDVGGGIQQASREHNHNRVLVIGLDGATFELLDRWMERGLMPNLLHLAKGGTRAVLRSVMPPVTAPAWVSCTTGVHPGKHGVFDFRKRAQGDISRRLVSALDIQTPTIWDIFEQAGAAVGLINVPVTYPPSTRTSFAISDLLTPSTATCFTNPPTLYDELRPMLGEYMIDAPPNHLRGQKAISPFLIELERCTRQRTRYALHLLANRAWDIAMIVFVGTDRLQHVLWDVLSDEFSCYPRSSELLSYKERAEQYLKLLDESIGNLLQACPPNTDVFIVSDHGFGPLKQRFKVNQWLASQGLLTPSRRRGIVGRVVARTDVFRLRHRLARLLKSKGGQGMIPFWRWINWSKTRAYAASITEMGIYVNLQGREAKGIVAPGAEYEKVRDQIIEGLTSLRHPQTGKPLVTLVARREEVLSGPHLEDAPDVIFILDDGACTNDLRLEGKLFEPASWQSGTGMHRFPGVLIAHGPRIRKGLALDPVEIVDVAPTILKLYGLPIPSRFDGRALTEMIVKGADTTIAARCGWRTEGLDRDDLGKGGADQTPYSEEESRQVEERLRGLGYL